VGVLLNDGRKTVSLAECVEDRAEVTRGGWTLTPEEGTNRGCLNRIGRRGDSH